MIYSINIVLWSSVMLVYSGKWSFVGFEGYLKYCLHFFKKMF